MMSFVYLISAKMNSHFFSVTKYIVVSVLMSFRGVQREK